MKKLFISMIIMNGCALNASVPEADQSASEELRYSPVKPATVANVKQFIAGSLRLAQNQMNNVHNAAKNLMRLLDVFGNEISNSDDLAAWQDMADGFVERMPKTLGAPWYVTEFNEALLTKSFYAGTEQLTLQSYLDEKIQYLENMECASSVNIIAQKKSALLQFYKNVKEELTRQKNKFAELEANKNAKNSLKTRVSDLGGQATIATLKYLVYARKALAAVAVIATGVFAFWLWNRPVKRCEPGVVYCK